ncbi:hypothetical protein KIW84_042476 [Lathyrus oleraceus]|uniref:Uncharacterized protein n=1 Tax=Pisum sativum TaxID=3888 RepID=A0A9D5AT39_PEA|nr:hypothetical protein KIW84_042476 [Pisum sativum]
MTKSSHVTQAATLGSMIQISQYFAITAFESSSSHYFGPKRQGHIPHGRGRCRGRDSPGNRPTSQLCEKYGNVIVDCWHRFDENFTLRLAQLKAPKFSDTSTNKLEASTSNPQALAMISKTHEYSLPRNLKIHVQFADFVVSHYPTTNSSYLHVKKSYIGSNRVCVANGKYLSTNYVGSSYVYAYSFPSYTLALNGILHVPCITRNLLSVSKFSKDNNVFLSSLLRNV